MNELAQIRERLRQNRAVRQTNLDVQLNKTPGAEARLGCTFVAGQRVFDRVTGEELEVIGGTRENVVIPVTKRQDG